ncbi:MAG: malic enzyme-like NAD(P)-binding protein [Patescibacteria group bacterium]|nr:malic enzyme-like NAD(P)-binding protein [Patescibacteria group bacterium]
MNYNEISIQKHKESKGKMEIKSKFPLETKDDLSIGYTPGVAAVCKLIAENPEAVYTHSIKANTIAVVSDGSAVLGLGNIGPEASLPVMEGKSILFKEFGNVDAFPICLDTQDTEEIIKAVKLIAPALGGINLEDISAPRCFEIEERLKQELKIPVFHDDQHGTAVVVLAGILNALKIVDKNLENIKIIMNGAGAGAMAVTNILMRAGAQGKNVIMFDSRDSLYEGREGMNEYKAKMASQTNPEKIQGLENALRGADVFIGLSVADVLKPEWVEGMSDKPIVFAMANPNPEISYDTAQQTKIAVFGTGRSDYPNQINNVLAFPGIFRGVLDARAPQITEEMKLAAAHAIASLITEEELQQGTVIPKATDKRVGSIVAEAVKKCV